MKSDIEYLDINQLPCTLCQYESRSDWKMTYHTYIDAYVNHPCSAPAGYLNSCFPFCCIPPSKFIKVWSRYD